MEVKKFKEMLSNNTCPFCKNKLKQYDGALGYESMNCDPCKMSIDHNGIHLEEE